MGMANKKSDEMESKVQDVSEPFSKGIKTDDDLQQEFNDLLKKISTEVLDSTVNQSIREASYVIQKQVPEIDRAIVKLRKETNDIEKVRYQMETLKQELKGLLNGTDVNEKLESLEKQIRKLENGLNKETTSAEKETETIIGHFSSLIEKNSEINIKRINKMEHVLMLQAIKQEEQIKIKLAETIKRGSILTLVGVAVLLFLTQCSV